MTRSAGTQATTDRPRVVPPLDPRFRPQAAARRRLESLARASGGGVEVSLGVEPARRVGRRLVRRHVLIGGSAAGVYVDSEVRVATLFRGVARYLLESRVRGIFRELREAWGVPFVVANDGT